MRLLVTGREGQVVRSLLRLRATQSDIQVHAVGRPELDLAQDRDLVGIFEPLKPDVIVNAAAYTAVDQAESDTDLAFRVNGRGAGLVARAARQLGIPVIQISTDYVFPGDGVRPYLESDPVSPVSAYGASKLAGERETAQENPNHAVLRTAWVYAPEGKNFVRTMLRLAKSREEVGVVADQVGNPTSADDIAAAVAAVAINLKANPHDPALRGIFHMTSQGETTWAGFADTIFRESAARGGPSARVKGIATSDYPTPAKRPANSRLDCSKLRNAHGVVLPSWNDGLARCINAISMTGEW
ncbi:dTDP-4-dehydrorhamnose reductase [Phreatobacter oligotrophus]|uniref:dTDP-4-dehydrorhamnose reductase n=1 Tax=Phreatobacter oligotrophus TaxID=1122261 RepID=A0A2T4Z0W0_9HYPH|nr:dTDP-4-dehydrorhamnose reductase [Phreatobacter oligotrophus]PTM53350.1 dTDP-4-dehydrorhamnose reductase [Phreatobacter oligotrophus]